MTRKLSFREKLADDKDFPRVRETLVSRHGATIACPIVTGIHAGGSTARALSVLLLLVSLGIVSCERTVGREEEPPMTGLFLIYGDAASPEELPEPTPDQQIASYDYKFLRVQARRPPRYLLISKRPDVVLRLAGPPRSFVGDRGFTELLLELTEDAAADMARVTRENIGKGAAFVIDGEVITAHKIREEIVDGHIQLSRCTDNACEYILARLTTR